MQPSSCQPGLWLLDLYIAVSLIRTFFIKASPWLALLSNLGLCPNLVLLVRSSLTCVPAKSLQLRLTLCNPLDCSLPGSSVNGILQARILEWVATPSSRGLPSPGIELASLMSPALTTGFFTTNTTWEVPTHDTPL